MADVNAPAALRELLDQLRDHVCRFGGATWLREHGEEPPAYERGDLMAHFAEVRAAVAADIDARVAAALEGGDRDVR